MRRFSPLPIRIPTPLRSFTVNISNSATDFAMATHLLARRPRAKRTSSSLVAVPRDFPPRISSAARIGFFSKKKITSAAMLFRRNTKASPMAPVRPTLTKMTTATNSPGRLVFIFLYNVQYLITGGDGKRVILPGALGCITHKLVEVLQPKYKDRMLDKAVVVAVVPEEDSIRVTYFEEGKIASVVPKLVLMCAPMLIASRIVMGLPAEQKAAMRCYRYAPYPVVNLIFDKPVYNRGYDTWCPGNSFTDFIVADWTVRNTPGYKQKHNILSFYTPLRPEQRSTLLTEEDCKSLATHVLADFQKLRPEFNVNPIEVRIFRRGHPMYMAIPGQYTKTRLAASHPMDRIFFGHSDSGGPESLTSEAVRLSKAGSEWAELVLAGKAGAKDLAERALQATPP